MDATFIVTTYVQIDDTLKQLGFQDDVRSTVSAAEILTVAVVAARLFQNHHERTLAVLQLTRYIPRFSLSRFNRRLHTLLGTLYEVLAALRRWPDDGVAIADSFPLPACQRVRSGRCAKLKTLTKPFFGRCVAKNTWFYGWRVHWVMAPDGMPLGQTILPASAYDLSGLECIAPTLRRGLTVVGDGGFLSQVRQRELLLRDGIRVIARHRSGIRPNTAEEQVLLNRYRSRIETAQSRLEKMGIQRLHARTCAGVLLKVLASLLALAILTLMD